MLALYLALAYITHETQGFYTYDFLDPADGGGLLAGYIIGILAAACVIFFLVWGVAWLRNKYTPPGKPSKYEDPRPSQGQRDIEMK